MRLTACLKRTGIIILMVDVYALLMIEVSVYAVLGGGMCDVEK